MTMLKPRAEPFRCQSCGTLTTDQEFGPEYGDQWCMGCWYLWLEYVEELPSSEMDLADYAWYKTLFAEWLAEGGPRQEGGLPDYQREGRLRCLSPA